jgi:hypothetical protein
LPVALSIAAFAVSIVSLVVTSSRSLRRPRIEPFWQDNADGESGLWVTVTARSRPIKVSALGVMHHRRTWRRQFPAHHLPRDTVPWSPDARDPPLQDGEMTRLWVGADRGRDAHGRVLYCYAVASGKVYFVSAHSRVRTWLAGLG